MGLGLLIPVAHIVRLQKECCIEVSKAEGPLLVERLLQYVDFLCAEEVFQQVAVKVRLIGQADVQFIFVQLIQRPSMDVIGREDAVRHRRNKSIWIQ